MELAVSILSIKDDKNKIKQVIDSDADYLHLDIMDGIFVNNKVEMYDNFDKKLDIHLMVSDVEKYIEKYINLNPENITFHIEANLNTKKYIDYLKSKNIKVGLAISPSTPVLELIEYLKDIDIVLVMSVNPGLGGQEFIMDSLNKIDYLYELRKENNYNYIIEVDGGVNIENASLLKKVDRIVVGSYITKSDDIDKKAKEFIDLK